MIKKYNQSREGMAKDYLDKLKEADKAAIPPFDKLKEISRKPDGHFCTRCVADYKTFNDHKRNVDPAWEDTYPNCNGSKEVLPVTKSEWIDTNNFATEEEAEDDYFNLRVTYDPVLWAAAELDIVMEGDRADVNTGNVNNMDRWYQMEMVRCSSQFKTYRCGRRTGKTFSMVLEVLHYLATNNGVRVLLITPYEKQLTEFFDTMVGEMLDKSDSLKNAFKYNKSTHELRFLGNGSIIKSLSTGGDKAGGGDKARGQKADLIVYDEVDYIAQGDIEASIAILLDNPHCKILMSTTPTGKRGFFYDRCTDKALRYKEFHLYSHSSPSVTKLAHDEMLSASSTSAFLREALAEFGNEMVGIFSNADIDNSLERYTLKQTRDAGPKSNCKYILGADWNGRAIGVHIVVTEYNLNTQKYKIVDVVRVRNQMYTQDKACTTIIELFKYWKASWIYVDAGAGDAQIEQIQKHARESGDEKLAQALVPVWMQSPTLIRNPLSGEEEKRQTKHYAVTLLANRLEKGLLTFPYEEDYKADGDNSNDADWGLVCQMRNFFIEKISVSGVPKYGDTPDHTLVGLYLSILGFQLKMSDLGTSPYDTHVGKVAETMLDPLIKVEGVAERNKDRMADDPNALRPGHYISRSMEEENTGVRSSSGRQGFGDDVMISTPGGGIKLMTETVKSQRAMQRVNMHQRRSF